MKIHRFGKTLLCIVLCVSMLVPFGLFYSFGEGTHGFYMECDAAVTNNRSRGFLIDFYSDSDDALCTYWSNANWHMYTRDTIKELGYKNLQGGGAYAGLQIRGSKTDHVGIMSMWRYEYRDSSGKTQYLYAESMMSKTGRYDNEGSGTSCILPYAWKNSQWYRELLYSWDDAETGKTFIGTWFYDYEADEWTLFTYYDTGLVKSFINTGISQFLENYNDAYNDRYRSFRYRNVYFQSYDTNEWIGSPRVKVFTDGNVKAVGECKMGVSDDGTYAWGSVDGSSEIDSDGKMEKYYTLVQDEKPTVGSPAIKKLSAKYLSDVNWTMTDNSTPQLSYEVVLTDIDGNELGRQYATRPNIKRVKFEGVETDAYKVTLTIKDVFGAETTAEYKSPAYEAAEASGNLAETISKLPFDAPSFIASAAVIVTQKA